MKLTRYSMRVYGEWYGLFQVPGEKSFLSKKEQKKMEEFEQSIPIPKISEDGKFYFTEKGKKLVTKSMLTLFEKYAGAEIDEEADPVFEIDEIELSDFSKILYQDEFQVCLKIV